MKLWIMALSLSLILSVSACSKKADSDRVKVYEVKGKVTMSGGPLIGANVAFAPREGQPVATGRTNDLGEYTLTTYETGDGAAAGIFAVVIKKVESSSAAAETSEEHGTDATKSYESAHDAKSVTAGGSLIPEKYGDTNETPFEAKVEAGKENTFDFDIN